MGAWLSVQGAGAAAACTWAEPALAMCNSSVAFHVTITRPRRARSLAPPPPGQDLLMELLPQEAAAAAGVRWCGVTPPPDQYPSTRPNLTRRTTGMHEAAVFIPYRPQRS